MYRESGFSIHVTKKSDLFCMKPATHFHEFTELTLFDPCPRKGDLFLQSETVMEFQVAGFAAWTITYPFFHVGGIKLAFGRAELFLNRGKIDCRIIKQIKAQVNK